MSPLASYCASGIAHTPLISRREASLGFKPSSHIRIVWVIIWIILKKQKALRDFFFFRFLGMYPLMGMKDAWTIFIINFSIPTIWKYQMWFDDWFGVYTNYLFRNLIFNFYNFNIWNIFTQNLIICTLQSSLHSLRFTL